MPSIEKTALKGYFDRIHYEGSIRTDYSTLSAIQRGQSARIPFENIDVLLGRRISLDDTMIFDKIVSRRRGGYCYELNLLLARILQQIGFSVLTIGARNRLNPLRDTVPRTHMALLVSSSSGEWIVDAGFGPYGLSGPIPFVVDSVHETGNDRYRISRSSNIHFELQSASGEDWMTFYEFTTEALPLVDFEMMNYYNSTAPNSRFLRSVVVACVDHDHRTILKDLTLRKVSPKGCEERTLHTEEAYEDALDTEFGIRLGADVSVLFSLLSKRTWS